MIPWTSSTHNFHFVAAFWFTHAAVSYASTVSLPQLCVCVWPFEVWSIHTFSIKKHAFTRVPVGSTHLHHHWIIEAQSTGTGNWSWNTTRVESIVSFRWDPGTRGYHHKCPWCVQHHLCTAPGFIAKWPAFRSAMAGRCTIEQEMRNQRLHTKTLHSNQASLSLICHCFYRDCQ